MDNQTLPHPKRLRPPLSLIRKVAGGSVLFFSLIMYCPILSLANDKGVNIPALADAIYHAEGGANTRHPYGILKKYKLTTPRQACINTIKSNLKRWNGQGSFIAFLGATYCPIGASNDPTGLNKNWVRNVKRLYEKRLKNGTL